jgi:hypothetical protein
MEGRGRPLPSSVLHAKHRKKCFGGGGGGGVCSGDPTCRPPRDAQKNCPMQRGSTHPRNGGWSSALYQSGSSPSLTVGGGIDTEGGEGRPTFGEGATSTPLRPASTCYYAC